MRTIPLVAAIFLAIFGHVSARGPDLSSASLIAPPDTGFLGSQMIGIEVYNNDHQNVARIADIALGRDGRVKAFVLSVGEYMGLVAHFVAVKPTALAIEANGDGPLQAHINASAAQLRAVPEYRYTGTRKACLNILRF